MLAAGACKRRLRLLHHAHLPARATPITIIDRYYPITIIYRYYLITVIHGHYLIITYHAAGAGQRGRRAHDSRELTIYFAQIDWLIEIGLFAIRANWNLGPSNSRILQFARIDWLIQKILTIC